MGLDIDSDDNKCEIWSGPYSSFIRFRRAIAKAMGMKEYIKTWPALGMPMDEKTVRLVAKMQGVPESSFTTMDKVNAELDRYTKDDIAVYHFFSHSDCDGEWTPKQCGLISKMLAPLMFKMPDEDMLPEKILKMVNGLNYCHSNNRTAIFH